MEKHFRRRCRDINVLNANDFWFPPTPDDVPLDSYFPRRPAAARTIEFVDIGCGGVQGAHGALRRLPEHADARHRDPAKGGRVRAAARRRAAPRGAREKHERRGRRDDCECERIRRCHQWPPTPPPTPPPRPAAAPPASLLDYENVWAIHNNAQRFMPNFFRKEQLSKLFFCFADPHLKRKNHRKRIVSHALLAEYAYVLKPLGLAYVITDVAELMSWMVEHFSQSVLFERLPREELKSDPTVPTLIRTDEGLKVQRNNGNMYIAVFRKRADPLAPRPPPPPNDNAAAADAAADVGYRPLAGGERRGMTR